ERERQQAEQAAARSAQVGRGERAEKIRTYNFPQDRVTDHRVGVNARLEDVLGGDLDEFTEALTADERRRALGQRASASASARQQTTSRERASTPRGSTRSSCSRTRSGSRASSSTRSTTARSPTRSGPRPAFSWSAGAAVSRLPTSWGSGAS